MSEVAFGRLTDQVRKGLGTINSATVPADSRRLFHGRGCCYPGFEQVTVDLYVPVMLVTFFKVQDETGFELEIVKQLKPLAMAAGLVAMVVQRRYLEGAPSECVWGELPAATFAARAGLRFRIQLQQRQNIGFFLDMEPGRRWLEARAEGKRVLNLFAYTCAFSVVAQQAGAVSVVNVDMSRGALSQGRDNHRLNQLPTDNIRFLQENILKSWSRIKRPGPYDLAVIDPPSYQPGSFVATRDYRKLIRRIPEFMADGGELLLCLNDPLLGVEFLTELVNTECPSCHFLGRIEPSTDFPDQNLDRQLKLLAFRFDGLN